MWWGLRYFNVSEHGPHVISGQVAASDLWGNDPQWTRPTEPDAFAAIGIDVQTGLPFSLFYYPVIDSYDRVNNVPLWGGVLLIYGISCGKSIEVSHSSQVEPSFVLSMFDYDQKVFAVTFKLEGFRSSFSQIFANNFSEKADFAPLRQEVSDAAKKVDQIYICNLLAHPFREDNFNYPVGTVEFPSVGGDFPSGTSGNRFEHGCILPGVGLLEFQLAGVIRFGEIDIQFSGMAWAQRQWNLRPRPSEEHAEYYWGYAEFANSTIIIWRYLYEFATQRVLDGHKIYISIDSSEGFRFLTEEDGCSYVSQVALGTPDGDQNVAFEGILKLPCGVYYLTRRDDARHVQAESEEDDLWRGCLLLRDRTPHGPIAGNAAIARGWMPPMLRLNDKTIAQPMLHRASKAGSARHPTCRS